MQVEPQIGLHSQDPAEASSATRGPLTLAATKTNRSLRARTLCTLRTVRAFCDFWCTTRQRAVSEFGLRECKADTVEHYDFANANAVLRRHCAATLLLQGRLRGLLLCRRKTRVNVLLFG